MNLPSRDYVLSRATRTQMGPGKTQHGMLVRMQRWSPTGKELRLKGINRIGNLLVPNNNYCKFEDWVMPILDTMLQEQREEGTNWTPSKIIKRLGSEMDDPTSIAYWASRNNIPVFSPALTDGSLGDMMYFHGIKSPGLVVDINEAAAGSSIMMAEISSSFLVLYVGLRGPLEESYDPW
ncbi:putative deoxyhypusine synthase [Chionoecetes opilio]|uniref:Deoxyhypusine synthase n=1 Tax=Chionoecetes opilio TaxID=41210 RepID=A0A8J4YJ04_CHIOP|nr:putative deoxyhypusine synthase [Chionoecetes opilio]